MKAIDASLTLMVSDLAASRRFYCDLLGFEVVTDAGPYFCMLRLGGFLLGLHPSKAHVEPRARSAMSISIRVEDIRMSVTVLQERGASLSGEVIDDDGGLLRSELSDPDGTSIHLIEVSE